MAKRSTPARQGQAKEDVRPQTGEVGADGELVRDSGKAAAEAKPEIKVVHAPAEAVEVERHVPEPKDDLNEKLAGIERDLKAERQAREAAERRASEAEERASKAGTAAQTNEDAAFRNHKTAIANAATAVKSELAAAKAAYVAAYDSGNAMAAADAQESIAEAKAKQMGIEAEQGRIEAWEKRPKQEPQREQPRQAQTPREAVDVRAMPRAARDYLDDHPEILDDWKLWNKLYRAHGDALDDGVDLYSDEYFEKYIHPRMGTGDGEQRPAPRRGRAGDGALPPSRGGPSNGGTTNATEVRLTAREADIAHHSWPELNHEDAEIEYAREKIRLQAEGRMGTKH